MLTSLSKTIHAKCAEFKFFFFGSYESFVQRKHNRLQGNQPQQTINASNVRFCHNTSIFCQISTKDAFSGIPRSIINPYTFAFPHPFPPLLPSILPFVPCPDPPSLLPTPWFCFLQHNNRPVSRRFSVRRSKINRPPPSPILFQ